MVDVGYRGILSVSWLLLCGFSGNCTKVRLVLTDGEVVPGPGVAIGTRERAAIDEEFISIPYHLHISMALLLHCV